MRRDKIITCKCIHRKSQTTLIFKIITYFLFVLMSNCIDFLQIDHNQYSYGKANLIFHSKKTAIYSHFIRKNRRKEAIIYQKGCL